MNADFFELWKEQFGTQGPSLFDREYETEKIVMLRGRSYSMKHIQLNQRGDSFSFYQFIYPDKPVERFFLDEPPNILEEEVDLPPYETEVNICTNKNLKFPIPKKKEIFELLSKYGLSYTLELESLLGLYKPFHFNKKWGIYMFSDNLVKKASWISLRTSNRDFTQQEIYDIVFWQTYFHEVYHHKIEMYATRLEFAFRKPIYKEIFHKFYCGSKGLDYCLEEAFAETYGALKCADHLAKHSNHKRRKILDFIKSEVLINRPPGYRVASQILQLNTESIKQMEYEFLEILENPIK